MYHSGVLRVHADSTHYLGDSTAGYYSICYMRSLSHYKDYQDFAQMFLTL